MPTIPDRYRLPLNATPEELERDGFDTLASTVNSAPEQATARTDD
ncbi:hypothetical protein ACF1AJ_19230 [Leifsonia sp. NPDC014704]|uniref:Uncharacterized protein n=1 Tax=Leifsonia virtsii TaxID=3035915 RepID=A0ABT8J327_9MICO|nr:hypothetical protein [Leifsonia virtsii]MDN4599392.1 hypothetical protein [Leifsonia virtsii]